MALHSLHAYTKAALAARKVASAIQMSSANYHTVRATAKVEKGRAFKGWANKCSMHPSFSVHLPKHFASPILDSQIPITSFRVFLEHLKLSEVSGTIDYMLRMLGYNLNLAFPPVKWLYP